MVKAGVLYFALTFGAGFALGIVRVLWAVPRFGERTAELLETPLMLVVIYFAAHFVVRRIAPPRTTLRRLTLGLLALALLVTTELTVVLALRGLTFREYVASRDPISGTVYVAMLVLFALMPVLVAKPIERRRAPGAS